MSGLSSGSRPVPAASNTTGFSSSLGSWGMNLRRLLGRS
jgi:hypothetical protein